MFFGKTITPSTPFKFEVSEANSGPTLSLTNVVLAPSAKEGGSLWIKKDGEEFLIVNLTKEKSQQQLNLFVAEED